jgi:hypothetical protein
MDELVRRVDYVPSATVVRVRLRTRCALQRVRDAALVREADDMVEEHFAQRRVDSSYALVEHTAIKATGLHQLVTALSQGDLAVEVGLRALENDALDDARAINRAYRRRPL